jgi:hypothetical protein
MIRRLIGRLKGPALAEDTIVIDDEEFERLFEDDGDSAGDGTGNAPVSDIALRNE